MEIVKEEEKEKKEKNGRNGEGGRDGQFGDCATLLREALGYFGEARQGGEGIEVGKNRRGDQW